MAAKMENSKLRPRAAAPSDVLLIFWRFFRHRRRRINQIQHQKFDVEQEPRFLFLHFFKKKNFDCLKPRKVGETKRKTRPKLLSNLIYGQFWVDWSKLLLDRSVEINIVWAAKIMALKKTIVMDNSVNGHK